MHKKMYLIKCSSSASFIPILKALPLVVPSRCLAYGTQSVGKRTGGVYPNGTLRRWLVPKSNKNIKNIFGKLKSFQTYNKFFYSAFFIQLFPPQKVFALRARFAKVQIL